MTVLGEPLLPLVYYRYLHIYYNEKETESYETFN